MKKKVKTKVIAAPNVIKNCNITGVQFDAKTVDTISLIATGLIENAKALGSLANVINSSNIHFDTLMKIG